MLNYNSSSNNQLSWILKNSKHLKVAIKNLPPLSNTLTIGDYGCSQGKNSISIINLIFSELKNLENTSEIKNIRIYHEDLPDNDFNEVKKCVEDSESGYLIHDLIKSNGIKIEPIYIGKSYYKPIVDKETLDIQFSYSTINWLPTYYPTQFGPIYSSEYNDPELTSKFNDLATNYFTQYLNLRHKELKTNGLAVLNFTTSTNYIHMVNSAWSKTLSKLGLQQSNFDKVSIPVYYLPEEIFKSILNDFSSKYKLVYLEKSETKATFTRGGVSAICKNQIISGLDEYPEVSTEFKAEFYDIFEDFMFDNGVEFLNTEGVMNFVVLKKN